MIQHQKLVEGIFAGNSQMAVLMRSHFISNTISKTNLEPVENNYANNPASNRNIPPSLRDVATWPPSLKTTIGIVLNAGCPMFCVWGGDRHLFYNDACLNAYPKLFQDDHHPIPPGTPISDKANDDSNHAWAGILFSIEHVFATGHPLQANLDPVTDHNGSIGDATYTWAYSPIWDEAGAIAGVFASGTRVIAREPVPHLWNTDRVLAAPQFQHLADALPVIIAVIDRKKRYCFTNKNYNRWVGKSQAELRHQFIWDVIGEDAYAVIRPYLEQALNGQSVSFEREITFNDGSIRYIEVAYTPQIDAQGRVKDVVALINDISERKRSEAERKRAETKRIHAETALQESEARFRRIADSSPIMIWMSAPDGSRTWFSQQWYDFTGQTPEDALEQGWLTALHPEDAVMVDHICSQAHQSRESVWLEYRLRRHDGVYRWVLDSAIPRFDDNGNYLGYVSSILDIHDRKQAEAEREQILLELVAERARFEAVLRQMPEGVLIADAATEHLILANDQTRQILRYDYKLNAPLETHKPLEPFEAYRPTGEPYIADEYPLARSLRTGEVVNHEEMELHFDDGTQSIIDINSSPVFDHQNRITSAIAVFQDITERNQMESVLRQSEEQAKLAISVARLGTWRYDIPTSLLELDQRMREIWGEPDDTNSLPLSTAIERVHADDRERVAKAIRAALDPTSMGIYEIDYRIVWNDGTERWITANGQVQFEGDGEHRNPVSFFGTALDITDRKQAEAALRESELRFRTLADNISQFAWMTDPTGWIFWYNKRWFDYTGTTLEEMQGWGWQAVLHPDHVDRVVEHFRHSFEAGEPWEDIFPLQSKDGTYRWFLSRALPIRDDEGNILRWFGTNTDITERRQAVEALAQRETELRILTNMVPALIAFVDTDGYYRFNNHQYEEWFGHPTTEIYGKHLREVLGEAAYEEIRPYVEQVLAGQQVSYESQIPYTSGTRFIHATYVPRFNDWGEVEGFVSLVNDISDRKRAEDALRQSEDRLRMAIESARLGIWDWHLTTDELAWDKGCKTIFGLPPEAETSIDIFFASIHPDDRDRIRQSVEDSLDPVHEGKYNAEFRTIGIQDGVERWVAAKGHVYFDDANTPYRFIGTALDITERKQFEQALMESEAIAHTRAEELSTVMATTPAAIWIAHDPQCHNITANQTAYELMGIQPGTNSTATPADGNYPLPFKLRKNGKPIPRAELPMQKAIRLNQEVTNEMEFVFEDGTIRYLYGKAIPLYTPAGDVRGAIAGFIEITALKYSEQERERLLQQERIAREEAENANRIKDEFLAILSHELRSPLNPILGWATLLKRGKLSADKTTNALETIERNAKLQIQLIDDLLDVSRIIRGKLSLNMVPISLASTIEAAVGTVRLSAEAKSIRIETHLDSGMGQVLGDSARLQQIVWNLLSNAVKFTPAGGHVKIHLSSVSKDVALAEDAIAPLDHVSSYPSSPLPIRYAQIQVKDTGKGIHPTFLPHVFEYFRQADSTTTRNFGGLGLGLAIVRYLVELHGGTIRADSLGEGKGATFTVYLPIMQNKNHDRGDTESKSDNPIDSLPLAQQHILLVDDDDDTRKLITLVLEEYGAKVKAVESGKAALHTLNQDAFNILISDIGMPNMDGYTLMQQIRSKPSEQGGDITAIALTAYAGEINQQKALEAGFIKHVEKPVEIDNLLKVLIEVMNTSL